MGTSEYVSVHGGHSGQFCNHATDSLEDIIQAYIEKKFRWVGITEHAPAPTRDLMYLDEQAAGLTPDFLFSRFGAYMKECRRLQEKYSNEITIFPALEIETYSGYETFVPHLIKSFKPDYIVGSVHYVNDINFDYSSELYERSAESVGGIDHLYEHYFDSQYEMISLLRPAVVGHFDLIRIFDPNYQQRLNNPSIKAKIIRNLELIRSYDLILDFNLRALAKGADEPYISRPILSIAREFGITIVPGDDSHGVASVGNFIDEGIKLLEEEGVNLTWSKPRLIY